MTFSRKIKVKIKDRYFTANLRIYFNWFTQYWCHSRIFNLRTYSEWERYFVTLPTHPQFPSLLVVRHIFPTTSTKKVPRFLTANGFHLSHKSPDMTNCTKFILSLRPCSHLVPPKQLEKQSKCFRKRVLAHPHIGLKTSIFPHCKATEPQMSNISSQTWRSKPSSFQNIMHQGKKQHGSL